MADSAPSDVDAEEVEYVEEVEYEDVEITDEEAYEEAEHEATAAAAAAQPAEPAAEAVISSAPGAAAPDATAAAAALDTPAAMPAAVHTSSPTVDAASSQADPLTVDQQASKMATEVAHLASEVAQKLQGGLLQAFSSTNTAASSSSSSKPQAEDTATAAAAATKAAAAAAAAAAAGLGSKLSSGLTGLGSWWQNIDQSLASNNTPLTAPETTPENRLAKSVTPKCEIVELFGLDANEALVDSYRCSLMQAYSCSQNRLTPPMQITFDGNMYITDKHTCFQALPQDAAAGQSGTSSSAGGRSSSSSSSSSGGSGTPAKHRRRSSPPLVFKIAHVDVARATRQPSPCPKGKSLAAADVLQIAVNPSSSSSSSGVVRKGSLGGGEVAAAAAAAPWSVTFQGFDPPGAMDGALALIEHLREG